MSLSRPVLSPSSNFAKAIWTASWAAWSLALAASWASRSAFSRSERWPFMSSSKRLLSASISFEKNMSFFQACQHELSAALLWPVSIFCNAICAALDCRCFSLDAVTTATQPCSVTCRRPRSTPFSHLEMTKYKSDFARRSRAWSFARPSAILSSASRWTLAMADSKRKSFSSTMPCICRSMICTPVKCFHSPKHSRSNALRLPAIHSEQPLWIDFAVRRKRFSCSAKRFQTRKTSVRKPSASPRAHFMRSKSVRSLMISLCDKWYSAARRSWSSNSRLWSSQRKFHSSW
mmetsp:Transcript_74631/g.209431  ORF Transcript_74631/g.209431 Transcript_74631/m.209431 type:complete len:290 (-) Transcript_74631:285-1154(-)